MNDHYQFELLQHHTLQEDKAWWEIYTASFPEQEREKPEVILRSLRLGKGLAFRVQKNGITIGIHARMTTN